MLTFFTKMPFSIGFLFLLAVYLYLMFFVLANSNKSFLADIASEHFVPFGVMLYKIGFFFATFPQLGQAMFFIS